MGHQIIQQPGTDLFAVFSDNTDSVIIWDATADELVDFYVECAKEDAAERTRRQIAKVLDPDVPKPYYQFTMTWEQALAEHAAHGHDPLDPPPNTTYKES